MKAVKQAAGGGQPAVSSAPERVPAQAFAKSRPLLLLERTMYREGRTPFTVVAPIRLLGVLDEQRLRHALDRIQAKHPALRSTVVDEDGRPSFKLLEQPAPIRLRIIERNTDDDWQKIARAEWIVPFDVSREPLARLVWLRGAEAHDLLLVIHHCVCDGVACLRVLGELLKVYDRPKLDIGKQYSLITLQDLVPAELLSDQRFLRRMRWKIGLFKMAFMLKRLVIRVRGGTGITPGQAYFLSWRTDKESSSAWRDACKREGVSIFVAVSIAFIMAYREVRGAKSLDKANTMVNVRRYLPKLRNDVMFGIAPGISLKVNDVLASGGLSDTDFWASARAFKAGMNMKIDRLGESFHEYLVGLETLHGQYPNLVAHADTVSEIRHITLTSIGRLKFPEQYQTFRLDMFHSPMVMVSPTPANTVVISSFAGRLGFSIVTDERSLPYEQAMAIKEKAMAIMDARVAKSLSREIRPANQTSGIRA